MVVINILSGMGHFTVFQIMAKFMFFHILSNRYDIIFLSYNIFMHKIIQIGCLKPNSLCHWYGTSRNKSQILPIWLYKANS